jgi:hypothetical protein
MSRKRSYASQLSGRDRLLNVVSVSTSRSAEGACDLEVEKWLLDAGDWLERFEASFSTQHPEQAECSTYIGLNGRSAFRWISEFTRSTVNNHSRS